MGYGKAVIALGFLMLILALMMHNGSTGLVGAIGVLLIIGGAGLGLVMTAIDPLRQDKKDKMLERQARDIEELNETVRKQARKQDQDNQI